MKLAATDYDGTLYQNDTICRANVEGVRLWRKAGNKFGVITGRDFGMLVPQLEHYGIEYDFTVCNNGAIIRNAKGKVVYQNCIENELLTELADHESLAETLHLAFSAVDCTYICREKDGSWIRRESTEWDFPIVNIEEKDIKNLKNIHQVSLGFMTPQLALACSEKLNKRFGSHVHAYPNRGSVDITAKDVSKRVGIENLLRAMEWQGAEIYVIGDEINDLPMIEHFGGYTVDTAREAIRKKAKESFASVGAMLTNFK
jgi:hypothetical protein